MSRRRTLAAVGLTTLGVVAAAASGYASAPTQTTSSEDPVAAASQRSMTPPRGSAMPDRMSGSMSARELREMLSEGEMRRHMRSPQMRHMHQMMMGSTGRGPGRTMGGMSESRRHHPR